MSLQSEVGSMFMAWRGKKSRGGGEVDSSSRIFLAAFASLLLIHLLEYGDWI